MSEQEKQIEEMARDIGDVWLVSLDGDVKCLNEVLWSVDIENIAIELHNIGYRKERQGEWIVRVIPKIEAIVECSVCHSKDYIPIATYEQAKQFECYVFRAYCGDCGAKMKGAE